MKDIAAVFWQRTQKHSVCAKNSENRTLLVFVDVEDSSWWKKMRKLLIVGIFLLCSTFSFALPFFMKCKMCKKEFKKDKSIEVHLAWRDFETPHVKIGDKYYTTYHCDGGHKYLVKLKGVGSE